MDRPLMKPSNNSSAMEVEITRQNSSSEISEPLQPASRFVELQLRRDKRRTSENRFITPLTTEPNDANLKACDFCRQLIIISIYDQHVLDCEKKIREQPTAEDNLMEKENEPTQDQGEVNLPSSMEVEENQLQVARPTQSQEPNLEQNAPENFFNLFGRFRNPIRSFSRPETSESRLPSPSSFFSTIFNSIFHPSRNAEQTNNLPITEGVNQPGQADQNENETDTFLRGALVVRTIQPGPNGSIIVRMRVIPLNGVFNEPQENQNQENTQANEPQEGRLLGSLLNMLMNLHGVHGGGFGDFLNIFQEEKGLEKEALDSLPTVCYDSEKFKNVDEESKKCSICLDQFEDKQEVRFLWCLHRFHKNCVDQWLDKHTNCPFCKKDYSEAVKGCEETI